MIQMRAQILVGWKSDLGHGVDVMLPIWTDAGMFDSLPVALAAMDARFPGCWLSLGLEGYIVHDNRTNMQVGLIKRAE